MIVYLFILYLFIIYVFSLSHKIEIFRAYPDIQDDRSNLCPVYADTFFDSHINTKEDVRNPFLEWCNDYESTQGHYPEYRSSERVFLKFKDIYAN